MDRRIALTLGLLVLVAVGADVAASFEPNTWIERDGRFYVNVNENILDEQSFEDPFAHSWYNGELGWNYQLPASFSNIALGARGEYYHFRPYLLPVLSTPFYWAFGLVGTLIFNALCFGVIAAFAYRFARAYAGEVASAAAAIALVLISGVRVQTYNYLADILLLALFAVGCAAMVSRRGLVTGLCLAAAITIKPPTILYAVPLALIFWERGDLRGLKRAIVGGAIGLGIAAAINTYMYGRPWWFGYNRALVVVDGQQQTFDDVDAFVTPLAEGMKDLWSGAYGVRDLYGIYLFALVGLVALARKHVRYVSGTVLACTAAYLLFSKFTYRFDRFLFPAFALLVPALAAGIELTATTLIRLATRVSRKGQSLSRHPALCAGVVVALAAVLTAATAESGIGDQVSGARWGYGALAIGDGEIDLRNAAGIEARTLGEDSVATRTRFDAWVPRASPLALLVAAPFTAAGGAAGLVVLHAIALGLVAFFGARVLERAVAPPIAAAVVIALCALPPLSVAVVNGGPDVLAAAAGLAAMSLALAQRFVPAVVLAIAAAWLADAPWLGAVGVFAIAAAEDRTQLRRVALFGAATLALWGVLHFVIYGRPFASPDDFVVVGGDAYRVRPASLLELAGAAIESAGPARALLPLLVLAPLGVLLSLRDRNVGTVFVALLLSLAVPGVAVAADGGWSALAAIGAGLPIAVLVARAGAPLVDALARLRTPRRIAVAVLAAIAVLAVVGGVRRGVRAAEPWQMASYLGVRRAEVSLDTIPCDFLAWENMSWECAHFDGGVMGRAGLALPRRPTVGGEPVEMWLVPSGRDGRRARRIRWHDLSATDALVLRYAAADGFRRGARVTVRVDGTVLETLIVPRDQARVEERRVDTARFAGDTVDLEVEVAPETEGGQAAIVLDGAFE